MPEMLEHCHGSDCVDKIVCECLCAKCYQPAVGQVVDDLTGADAYEALVRLVKTAPPLTPEELETQRFDFAYGNLAASTNHKPSRAAFWKLASERGWTKARFEKFAKDKEWLP